MQDIKQNVSGFFFTIWSKFWPRLGYFCFRFRNDFKTDAPSCTRALSYSSEVYKCTVSVFTVYTARMARGRRRSQLCRGGILKSIDWWMHRRFICLYKFLSTLLLLYTYCFLPSGPFYTGDILYRPCFATKFTSYSPFPNKCWHLQIFPRARGIRNRFFRRKGDIIPIQNY